VWRKLLSHAASLHQCVVQNVFRITVLVLLALQKGLLCLLLIEACLEGGFALHAEGEHVLKLSELASATAHHNQSQSLPKTDHLSSGCLEIGQLQPFCLPRETASLLNSRGRPLGSRAPPSV
jgi:hypothetical protein